MSVRITEADNSIIIVSIGAAGFVFGPGTIVAVVRMNAAPATNTSVAILSVGADSTARYNLLATNNASNQQIWGYSHEAGAQVSSPTANQYTVGRWYLVGFTKATGTVTGVFHIYDYVTDTWLHVNASGTQANSLAPITQASFGLTGTGTTSGEEDIAAAAVWDSVLTNTQIESLAKDISFPNWSGYVRPKGMWLPSAQTVYDLSGGGANETSRTGAIQTADEHPLLNQTIAKPTRLHFSRTPLGLFSERAKRLAATIAGQEFAQALTATTVVVTASMTRQVGKILSSTAVVSTASMVRQVGKILSATSVVTASIIKRVNKTLTATTVAVTATLLAQKVKTVLMTATTVVVTASMTRQVGKILSASSVVTATFTKRINKALTATSVVVTATLATIKVKLVSMVATSVVVTATMVRRTNKTLSASVATSATLTKGLLKTLTAVVTVVATLVREKIVIPVLTCITPGVLTMSATGIDVLTSTCITPGVHVLVCVTPTGLTLVCITPGGITLTAIDPLHA